MNRIEEILAFVNQIPPFPKVARRVIELLEDPDVNAGHLAEVIQYDQAITANIMKMCNAAYFGLPRKISSISEAVVMLGRNTLKELVIAGASVPFYEGGAGNGYRLDEGELWKHSVAVGLMAKLLGRHVRGIEVGSAFTVGLLHDIGKRFLSTFVSDEFEKIMDRVEKGHCSFVTAEQDIIGIDHAELGAIIMEKWEFIPSQVEAVRKHHIPHAMSEGPMIALTALSNSLVKDTGVGKADIFNSEIQSDVLNKLGINRSEIQSCMSDLLLEMDKARDLVRM